MALIIKPNGRVFCAAMHKKEEDDIYLHDGISYVLTVVTGVLVTDDNHCIINENGEKEGHGEWWWINDLPENIKI